MIFTTWKWGAKYDAEYVYRLSRMLRRYQQGRGPTLVCFTDDPAILSGPYRDGVLPLDIGRLGPKTAGLLRYSDGCYARLWLFSTEAVDVMDSWFGVSRVINLDLDCVVVDDLEPLITRPVPLSITHGIHYLDTKYNGSMIVHDLGTRPQVWDEFDIERAERVAWRPSGPSQVYQGTDQSWLWHILGPDVDRLTPADGVYGYTKPGWPRDGALPDNARIVFFPGSRDPGQPATQAASPWIKEFWR